MTKDQVRAQIEAIGIIPAVRAQVLEDAMFAAGTVAAAGIPIVEITMTTPGAVTIISRLAASMPNLVIGAGTVLDVDTARRCLDAGAGFITSPGLDVRVVEFTVKQDVLVLPGVMTPTDVMTALQTGVDVVKVFPCAPLGGPAYLKTLSAPFPQIAFVASGGVDQRTVADYIAGGAVAVGIGKELIPRRAVEERDERWISELARRFLNLVRLARTFA